MPDIYRDGVAYAKAGVMLGDFSSGEKQALLFVMPEIRNDTRLMGILDGINQKQRHSLYLAAQGIGQRWAMKRDMLSPAYTTRWDDIPVCH